MADAGHFLNDFCKRKGIEDEDLMMKISLMGGFAMELSCKLRMSDAEAALACEFIHEAMQHILTHLMPSSGTVN